MTAMNSAHSPVLQHAVAHVQPGFYAWPERRQLHYRMHMPDDERFVLERTLFHDLYGIDCRTREGLRSAWDAMELAQLDTINEALLPWRGIGENSFFLQERLSDADRLRFDTLDHYARYDYVYQEAARKRDSPTYVTKPYQGDLYACWARLMVDGRLRYAGLHSLAGHLSMHIASYGQELLDTFIPSRFMSAHASSGHDGEYLIQAMHRDAGGMELQLHALTQHLFEYERKRWLALLEEFDQRAEAAVYIRDVQHAASTQLNFVFSDQSALRAVRLRHFMRDCRRLEHDGAQVAALEQRENALLRAFLQRQLETIRRPSGSPDHG